MGFYIDTENSPAKGKATYLIAEHGADELPGPPSSAEQLHPNQALVCVVENPNFDAAGVIPDDDELARCQQDSPAGPSSLTHENGMAVLNLAGTGPRKRRWLIIEREHAKELVPELRQVEGY